MEKREQVFVSSTYLDLQEPREKVIQGLLEADCFPAGMEMFPASDLEKWDLIKGVIDDSDYYLLIIGGRYGSEGGEHQLSYTEQEYDYAVSQKKPVMAFLYQNPGSLAVDQTDNDPEKAKKLASFREKVEQKMVKYWSSADQLAGLVAQALIKLRKTRPAVGWVRGNHALTPEKELEISELKRELDQLRAEMVRQEEGRQAISDLSSGADDVAMMMYANGKFVKPDGSFEWKGKWFEVTTSWDSLLGQIGPTLLQESPEDEFLEAFLKAVRSDFWDPQNRPDRVKSISAVQVDNADFGTLVVQFSLLGFIEPGQQKRPPSDIRKYWKLTQQGTARLMQLRAVKKTVEVSEGVVNCDEVSAAIREKDGDE